MALAEGLSDASVLQGGVAELVVKSIRQRAWCFLGIDPTNLLRAAWLRRPALTPLSKL